jgi:hypothetical protein
MKSVIVAGWYLSVAFGNIFVIIIAEVKIFQDQVGLLFFLRSQNLVKIRSILAKKRPGGVAHVMRIAAILDVASKCCGAVYCTIYIGILMFCA